VPEGKGLRGNTAGAGQTPMDKAATERLAAVTAEAVARELAWRSMGRSDVEAAAQHAEARSVLKKQMFLGVVVVMAACVVLMYPHQNQQLSPKTPMDLESPLPLPKGEE